MFFIQYFVCRGVPLCIELAEIPSMEEVRRAVGHLSNNKSPGESGILPEMIKYAGPEFFNRLLLVLHQV